MLHATELSLRIGAMKKVQIPVASRQTPLSDVVERELERRIISGQWAEGFRLPSEGKLCLEFGVSRTAVREALRELRGRGIIDTVKGSGSYVSGGRLDVVSKAMNDYSNLAVDEKSISDLIEFRVLIEGAALQRLARADSNAESIQALEKILKEMDSEQRPEPFGQLDSQFHLTILKTCNNAFISMIGQTLYNHYVRCIGKAHALADDGMRAETIKEHTLIVQSLKSGDGDAAREALEQHLLAAGIRGKKLGVQI